MTEPMHDAAQQRGLAEQFESVTKQLQKQIEQADIHQLMDQFDAPKIVLQTPVAPTVNPGAFLAVGVPQIIMTTAGSTQLAEPATTATTASTAESATSATASGEATPPTPPSPPAPKAPTKTWGSARASSGKKGKPNATSAEMKIEKAENDDEPKFVFDNTIVKKRPAWVDSHPRRTGNFRREVIATEEYATEADCYAAGDVYLLLKTYDHVRQLENLPYQEDDLPSITFQNGSILANGSFIATGKTHPQWNDLRVLYLQKLGINADYLRRELIAKDPSSKEPCEYLETVERSFGPMKKLYLQVEYSPAFDREVKQRLEANVRQSRFGMVGAGAASVLALLGGVWGLLTIDTATKGYYSKWLFIGVPTAIIICATLVSVIASFA
jgi:hypothetical protein